MSGLEWQASAACLSAPEADAFFPAAEQSYSEARRYCLACPVVDTCLDWALDIEGDAPAAWRWGMYGALTPQQRTQVAVSRGVTIRQTPTPPRQSREGCPWPGMWRAVERHRARTEPLCPACQDTADKVQAVEAGLRAGRSPRLICVLTGAPTSLIRAVAARMAA